MRPDVKLGIVISLVVVVVAGGYYVYRDARDVPIPVSGGPADLGDAGKQGGNAAPAGPAAGKQASRNRSAAPGGPAAQRRSTNGANPSAKTGGNAPARRQANRPAAGSRNNTANTPNRSPRNERMADPGKAATNEVGDGRTAAADRRSGGAPARNGSNREATAPRSNETNLPKTTPGTSGVGSPTSDRTARQGADAGNRVANREGRPDTAGRRGDTSLTSRSAGQNDRAPATNIAVETHRLQPGDTLAGLSMAYYGSERHVPVLLAANPQISDPSRLRVGTIIKIPPAPNDTQLAMAERTTSRNPPPEVASDTSRSYTVKPGDSFYAIAESQLGSSSRWEELFELNKSLVKGDPKRLQIGQVIELPDE